MKVLLNKDNVIIAKAEDIKETQFGFYIKKIDTYYIPDNLTLVETNLNVEVQKHKLVNGQIVANENYKTFEQIEAEIEALQKLQK
jgi:hypothetical protein